MEFPGSLNRWYRYHMIPQLAVYTTYIPLIYCQLGWLYITDPTYFSGTRKQLFFNLGQTTHADLVTLWLLHKPSSKCTNNDKLLLSKRRAVLRPAPVTTAFFGKNHGEKVEPNKSSNLETWKWEIIACSVEMFRNHQITIMKKAAHNVRNMTSLWSSPPYFTFLNTLKKKQQKILIGLHSSKDDTCILILFPAHIRGVSRCFQFPGGPKAATKISTTRHMCLKDMKQNVSDLGGKGKISTTWWLNQPNLKNMLVNMGSSSPGRGEHKKYLSCHHLVKNSKYAPSK